MLAVLALLPVGRLAELPLALGAVAGLCLLWRARGVPPGARLAALLFACYASAAIASLPTALAVEKSASTVLGLFRFLPFAGFVAFALRDAAAWPRLIAAIAMLVMLWLLDAWVQMVTGYGIAGASSSERLSGVFGAGNLKLGPVLAVLAPFVFVAARARFGRAGLIAAFLFQLPPILLAGSRAAWLMYALVSLAWLWRETRTPRRFVAWTAGALALVVAVAALAWWGSGMFDARVRRSLLAFEGSAQSLDEAGAGRLRIWHAAGRMIAAHPLTGVGVRGFRYAYPTFADANDSFVDPNTEQGAAHAHQLVLEVLSETGLVGLAFWLIGASLAIRAWYRASIAARERASAPAQALAAMCFPLNTHLAFYSAWWGLLFWWLLALYCAALGAEDASAS